MHQSNDTPRDPEGPGSAGPGSAGPGSEPSAGPIVVGFDGSPSSMEALRWAVVQAELTGTAIEALSTWEWPVAYGWAGPMPLGYDPGADASSTLATAVEDALRDHPTVTVHTTISEGSAAVALVSASRNASLLVVGGRGHGEFAGMLLGSVSQHCATHSHCPVVIHRRSRRPSGTRQ